MSFLLKVTNPALELVFSSSGITYSYVGMASFVSLAQATNGPILKGRGVSTYSIVWPGDILVALPVKANGTTSLINTTRSGDTWTILVHKGSGAFDANGFDIEEATEVYVFGSPGAAHGWGGWLYDASGNCVADLARIPLTWRARLTMGANVISWPLPGGVGVPAMVGWPMDRNITSVRDSAFYINRYHGRGWQLEGGSIVRNIYQDRWVREDGGASPVDLIRPIDAILIDASNLN
ncbi:hypothetical protein CSQ90_26070 [Janthinobacterium sp. BJB303]|nr:hypothetical protein CSQ90_26070 [Janthinobacterium sp. BJB303]